MIIFKKIRFKNFLSTGDQFNEIDFLKASNTLIVGSNGAGKSTMLDALTFSLFGKSFRGINKPQLVNSVNEKDCLVEIEFDIGTTQYLVRRGIKPSVFEIYKDNILLDQQSSAVEQQKWIEQVVLKMNYKSFTQIVIIGSSNFVPFMQLSSANRREVIEDLLDIKIFSSMSSILKDKIKEYKQDVVSLNYKKDHFKNKIDMQNSFIEKLDSRNKEETEKILNKIELLKGKIKSYTKNIEEYQSNIDQLSEQSESLSKSSSKIRSLENLKLKLNEKINNLKREINFFGSNATCPTCTQDISESIKLEKISKNNEKKIELDNGLDQLDKLLSDESNKNEKFLKLLSEISEYNKKISIANSELSNFQNLIIQFEKEIVDLNSENSNRNEEYKKLVKFKEELNEVFSEISEKNEEINYFEYCFSLLKEGGAKSKIIKKYIPFINNQINKYLQMMDFYINFTLDEEFNETIKTPIHEDFTFSSFSEGERSRINLSLLFAWRELAKFKNSVNCNLIVFDEVFDSSLDGFGTDEFLKIIRYVIKDANIFVISHKTGLEDKFESVIKFSKVKGFSRIEQ